MGALTLALNDSFLVTDENAWTISQQGIALYVSNFNYVYHYTFTFSDSLNFTDFCTDQPLFTFNDSFSIIDGFILQLGSLLLFFDSDFLLFDSSIIQETVTSLNFVDSFNINDSFFSATNNQPSFGDAFLPNDSTRIIVGLNLIFNDSFTITDFISLFTTGTTILLVLGDNIDNFNDGFTVTNNSDLLNVYLRRYLNDVISN